MNYVQAGMQYVGIVEDAGPNMDHAGRITAMLASVGAAPGSPWCAALVSQCFRDAGAGGLFPYSASSQAIKQAFKQRGLMSTDPQAILGWHGAIGGWTDVNDPSHGHIFLITGRLTISGNLVAIQTIEGNTNGLGSEDGNGCFAKRRILSTQDGQFYAAIENGIGGPGHRLWFLDTSGIVGGRVWS